ncbi:conserved hypothetical protein [groundwater metagenome]|uniref:Flavodoxin-like domain-containing protein n=1 Tax=groundwater metagenome TaxID=717931 RepID=A0A098E882_9ZZZZ
METKIDVLGISGSPRKGNTEILVKKALDVCEAEGLKTKIISLADDISTDEILNDMVDARAIIIGSPTYFANVPAKLKELMDKTIILRRQGRKLKNKIGGAIAVGGSRNGGQEYVILAIHNFMLIHEMLVVSDKETAHFGGIAIGRNLGDVLNDKDGLETTENLAKRIVEILKYKF